MGLLVLFIYLLKIWVFGSGGILVGRGQWWHGGHGGGVVVIVCLVVEKVRERQGQK